MVPAHHPVIRGYPFVSMSPTALFWTPVAVRLCLVAAAGLTGWYVWGLSAGLALALVVLTVMVLMQLSYMFQLSQWLDNPDEVRLSDGWGSWTDIFAKLYKLRRDEQRTRSELAEWLSRFRQAMSQLPDGVVIMDDVLFLEWCNPVAEEHFGLSLDTDKGMRVTNLIRSPEFIDYIILGKYDEPLTLSTIGRKLIVHVIPFENRRQILVSHDVTRFEQLDQMRRDFIANASHELRTPLTVINGFLEIALSEPDLDAATRTQHLKLMAEQGKRMENLVEDMLHLTRLESVEYPLREEHVDMAALLGQVQAEGQALSGGRHQVTLSCSGPDLCGSTDELRSAIGNLVSNAVRYTPAGGTIAIDWSDDADGPRCTVTDTGIGIRPEHIVRLTERFYRVDKSRSRETRGTGLGLAIVRHVLLRHHAQLQVESEAGKGSRFTMRFPRSAVVLQAA
jgi:two-component system phosphate regulon sensor histidine kinase PhoR